MLKRELLSPIYPGARRLKALLNSSPVMVIPPLFVENVTDWVEPELEYTTEKDETLE
jgi:hypothetical protein